MTNQPELKACDMPDERDTAYLNIRIWLQQAIAHSGAGAYQNMHDKVATALHHLPIIKPISPSPIIPEDAVQYVSDDAPPEGFMYATGSELFQVLGKSKEDADSLERGVNAVIRRTDMASVTDNASATGDALRGAVEYLLNFNGQEHIVNLWDESFTTEGKGKLCNALETLITHALNAEHRGKLLECYGGTEKCGEALADERYKAYMQGFNDAMKGQSK